MRAARTVGVIWGILGVTLIIGGAIMRLFPHVLEAFRIGFSPIEWSILVAWCAFMLIAEGYRGFQKLFSPRVAARTWHLMNNGQPLELILAPFYCIGYFHATRKRLITSWSVTAGITLLVIIVRYVPQPWRGIIDSGVLVGLLYGLIWVYVFTLRTFKTRSYIVDPEVNLS